MRLRRKTLSLSFKRSALVPPDQMQGFLFSKPVPGEIFEARFLALLSAG